MVRDFLVALNNLVIRCTFAIAFVLIPNYMMLGGVEYLLFRIGEFNTDNYLLISGFLIFLSYLLLSVILVLIFNKSICLTVFFVEEIVRNIFIGQYEFYSMD